MADAAALQSLLSNLGQLVNYHVDLIAGVRQEVDQLTNDLNYFDSFLKYASRKKLRDERARQLVGQIREALYDAEDAVDLFVTQNLSSKSKHWLRRLWPDPVKLDRIAQKVRRVMRDVSNVYGDKSKVDLMLLELGDEGTEMPEFSPVREKNVVGLEDEAEKIIGYIKEETQRLDVISIVGMPGLGKSTLAGKIFRDPDIMYEFPTRLWVYVSKFSTRDVYVNILREFTSVTDEVRGMKEHELAEKVKGHLERGKFLIVMDDVWTEDDWRKIARALPANNHLGKILITSRYANVAASANSHRHPHNLRPLLLSESVQLLQYEVFGEPRWEPEFEGHGIIIAEKCKGLPLAIVVIGGIIVKKLAAMVNNPIAKLSEWRSLSERVPQHISDDLMMDRVIALSYEALSFHLKACFLYFAMFPEDVEIPTWKLFRMWIAEGFIEGNRGFTSEETAKSYLDELITRNLVRVEKTNSYGKVKTCRIHDTLREFCKKRAGEENFLDEIVSVDGTLTPASNNKSRRLCIHSNISTFVSSKPLGQKVRSFVCCSKEDVTLQQHTSAITGAYKLLRVLDVEPIKLTKIPSDIGDLLHLRHIHLSCNMKILPTVFSELWNVQTLVFDTTERTLTVKADIWKLRHLRLMKTNAAATLPEPSSREGENNIQTLGSISPENCTEKVLNGARNLRRLSIRGELKSLLGNGKGSFDNMMVLAELEKLKLQNDPFPKSASEVPLPHLPPSEKFPPKLRILTLSKTCLDWNQMKVVASLCSLEVLKLKEKAFTGNYWEAVKDVFLHLKVLFIGSTDLVFWKTAAGIFPELVHLELHNCEKLREVPPEFGRSPSLDVLVLNHCGSAAASAKTIGEERTKMMKESGGKAAEFKLAIFPK